MKNLSFLLFISSFILMIHSSCDHDKDVMPDYVGKWVIEIPVPTATGFATFRDSLDLKDDTFVETFRGSCYPSYQCYKFVTNEGIVSAEDNSIMLVPTKIIETFYYDFDMKNIDISLTYTNKDENFSSNLEGLVLEISNHKMEYSIVGNTLTLKADKNNDGDYSDYFETIVYTRQ